MNSDDTPSTDTTATVLFPGIDAADLWESGSGWSRLLVFGDTLLLGNTHSFDDQCEARRAHSATLASHGVCPLCFTRQPRWRTVCAACDSRLVRLQVPSDMARHGLVPLTGNRIPRAEVRALPDPPPLCRGEHHVAPPRLPARVPDMEN